VNRKHDSCNFRVIITHSMMTAVDLLKQERLNLASGEISISVGAEPNHVQAENLKKWR
jgi:hypothetical protein